MSTLSPDKNFCTIAESDDGSLYGKGGPWGPDPIFIHDESRPALITIPGGLIPTEEEQRTLQDTLKCAGLKGVITVTVDGDIVGCREDCIDVTRSRGGLTINCAGDIIPTGKHAIILKGESAGVSINAKMRGHGSQIDVEIGGYYGGGSLPDLNGKTIETTLGLTCSEPISIRQFSATAPFIANTQAYKHDKIYELIYPLWLWFRKRGIGK